MLSPHGAPIKAALAYFVAAATFLSVAQIEGIQDGRATQVCMFFGAQPCTLLLINDDELTWASILAATVMSSAGILCFTISPIVVTPPHAWLFLAFAVLVACGLSRYVQLTRGA